MLIRGSNLIISMPADVLAPGGARPSAGTMMVTKLDIDGSLQDCSISIANS